jgi:hypothetical protein
VLLLKFESRISFQISPELDIQISRNFAFSTMDNQPMEFICSALQLTHLGMQPRNSNEMQSNGQLPTFFGVMDNVNPPSVELSLLNLNDDSKTPCNLLDIVDSEGDAPMSDEDIPTSSAQGEHPPALFLCRVHAGVSEWTQDAWVFPLVPVEFNYYAILKLPMEATQEEIQVAHQHAHAPGMFAGRNWDHLAEVDKAFETLGNPEKRRHYDNMIRYECYMCKEQNEAK